mmetsp:Transcript_18404/g.69628  ORF Transcript_18404/g.69628 Transcript_18404/m.69628 type:complete len:370 (+) Transcript_18404:949-2058(+)
MAIVDVLGVETAVKESCDPQPTILLSRKVLVIQPPSVVGVATSQSQLTLSIREAIVGPKKVPLVLTQLVMNHLVVKHLVLVDAQISSARLSPPLQRDPLWVRLEGAAEAQGTGPANPALHGQREGFKPSALDEQGRLLVLARTHEQILAQPAALSSPKGRIGVALVLLVLCRGEGPARKYDSILFMEQRKARPILGIIGSRGHLPGEEHGGPLPSASPDQNEADDFRQQDAARVRSPDDEVGGLEVKLDLRPLHQHDGEDAEEGEVHLEVQQRDVWWKSVGYTTCCVCMWRGMRSGRCHPGEENHNVGSKARLHGSLGMASAKANFSAMAASRRPILKLSRSASSSAGMPKVGSAKTSMKVVMLSTLSE